MTMLPAPKVDPPQPDRPAPPGMAWLALWAWAGESVVILDKSGDIAEITRPLKRIGYVLGLA